MPYTAALISEGLKVNKASHSLRTYALGNQQCSSAENRKLIAFHNLMFMLTLAYAGGYKSGWKNSDNLFEVKSFFIF